MSRDGKFDFFYIQEFVSYIQSFTHDCTWNQLKNSFHVRITVMNFHTQKVTQLDRK